MERIHNFDKKEELLQHCTSSSQCTSRTCFRCAVFRTENAVVVWRRIRALAPRGDTAAVLTSITSRIVESSTRGRIHHKCVASEANLQRKIEAISSDTRAFDVKRCRLTQTVIGGNISHIFCAHTVQRNIKLTQYNHANGWNKFQFLQLALGQLFISPLRLLRCVHQNPIENTRLCSASGCKRGMHNLKSSALTAPSHAKCSLYPLAIWSFPNENANSMSGISFWRYVRHEQTLCAPQNNLWYEYDTNINAKSQGIRRLSASTRISNVYHMPRNMTTHGFA